MNRRRCRNKFFNTKNETDRKTYNKQRNYCLTLIKRKVKKTLLLKRGTRSNEK